MSLEWAASSRVNFDPQRLVGLIRQAIATRDVARHFYERVSADPDKLQIAGYIRENNKNPKPFVWTASRTRGELTVVQKDLTGRSS
jgi:hypothetical protein